MHPEGRLLPAASIRSPTVGKGSRVASVDDEIRQENRCIVVDEVEWSGRHQAIRRSDYFHIESRRAEA